MAKNDTIALKLVADNNDLTKKLGQSTQQIKRLEKQLERAGKGGGQNLGGVTKSMGLVAGATLGASKAFDFLESSIHRTEELTKATLKLSKVTGLDNVSSAEFVQVAQSRGVSAEKLNTSFTALSKGIYAATHGSKAQAEAFDQLGVSQKALDSGDLKTVLMQVSDGLKAQTSDADRLALSQKLLGRGGKDLMGVFAGGSSALKESLGMYKANAEAIAEDSGNTKQLAADKRKLNSALDGVKVSLGTAVIPYMRIATDVLTKFSNLSPGMRKAIVTLGMIAGVAFAVSKVTTAFKVLTLAMKANPWILLATVAIAVGFLIWKNWSKITGWLKGAFNTIKATFWTVAHAIQDAARKGFLGPAAWVITHWSQVTKFISGLPSRLGGYAKSAGTAMWNGIKSGASSVVGFFKGIANGVVGTLEGLVNNGISGINRLIDLANNVPGVHIGKIGNVSIPRLAQGGLVTSPTLAMVGEAGPEAVVPLSRPTRAAQVMRQAGLAGSSNSFVINNYGSQLDESALAAKIGWQLAARGVA